MPRVCFLLRVKASRIEEYRARHEAVWPDGAPDEGIVPLTEVFHLDEE